MEEHRHDCDTHAYQLKNHEDRLNKIDVILDKVRNRPPVWATFILGALLAVIGGRKATSDGRFSEAIPLP
jgi:hypothetical protein